MAATVFSLAAFAAPSSADTYYCNQVLVGYTRCPQRVVGSFNVNHGYVPGSSFGGVCESAYIYQTSDQVSRNCANNAYATSDSGCPGDLWYWYNNGYTLVGYVGNNQSVGQYISGHVYVETEGSCE
jgi:hypothetical protein